MVSANFRRREEELLRFLFLKTAAVRAGIKPGELLRVRHWYRNEDDSPSLHREEVLRILRLDYCELRRDAESSLILFYHHETMRSCLGREENREVLRCCSYPDSGEAALLLRHLCRRCEAERIPHEVGVFLGYPAKDVAGFLNASRPSYRGSWQVFGEVEESLHRMNLYRQAETAAASLWHGCGSIQEFFEQCSVFLHRKLASANLSAAS